MTRHNDEIVAFQSEATSLLNSNFGWSTREEYAAFTLKEAEVSKAVRAFQTLLDRGMDVFAASEVCMTALCNRLGLTSQPATC